MHIKTWEITSHLLKWLVSTTQEITSVGEDLGERLLNRDLENVNKMSRYYKMMNSKTLLYISPLVNNTLLYTLKFVKRVDMLRTHTTTKSLIRKIYRRKASDQ